MARLPLPSWPASLEPQERSETEATGAGRGAPTPGTGTTPAAWEAPAAGAALVACPGSGTSSRVWQPPHATGAAVSCRRSAKRMASSGEAQPVTCGTRAGATPSRRPTAARPARSSASAPSPLAKKWQVQTRARAVACSEAASPVGSESRAHVSTATRASSGRCNRVRMASQSSDGEATATAAMERPPKHLRRCCARACARAARSGYSQGLPVSLGSYPALLAQGPARARTTASRTARRVRGASHRQEVMLTKSSPVKRRSGDDLAQLAVGECP
eukprot:scaffold4950_cov99-Isochrysis_galbana.AAC.5